MRPYALEDTSCGHDLVYACSRLRSCCRPAALPLVIALVAAQRLVPPQVPLAERYLARRWLAPLSAPLPAQASGPRQPRRKLISANQYGSEQHVVGHEPTSSSSPSGFVDCDAPKRLGRLIPRTASRRASALGGAVLADRRDRDRLTAEEATGHIRRDRNRLRHRRCRALRGAVARRIDLPESGQARTRSERVAKMATS
jgi:hypothetical protein